MNKRTLRRKHSKPQRGWPWQRILRSPRLAFTLVEMLVVIGIIAFLVSISYTVVANYTESAQEAATKTTLVKLDEMTRQQQEALANFLDNSSEMQETVDRLHQGLRTRFQVAPSKETLRAILRKKAFSWYMPQNKNDIQSGISPNILGINLANNTTLSPRRKLFDYFQNNIESTADSSECLYFFLTEVSVGGSELPDISSFRSSELTDTDGDGLLEFQDSWGQPLRFYRWPTRMFRPTGLGQDERPGEANVNDNNQDSDNSNDNPFTDDDTEVGWADTDDGLVSNGRTFAAGLLIQNLPPAPTESIPDLLAQDPEDPFGLLVNDTAIKNLSISNGATGIDMWQFVNEDAIHTPATFHSPLIVSAGPDEQLGMFEPDNTLTDTSGEADLRSALSGAGDVDAIMTWLQTKGRLGQPFVVQINGTVYAETDTLVDNLVNRNVSP